MLKHRLIPVLLIKDEYLVRRDQFVTCQNLGKPNSQIERYNEWDVDELILIDISTNSESTFNKNGFKNLTKNCFMPLSLGGRIRSIEDIRACLWNGADKITINTQAVENPNFITQAAQEFGSQAITVSIDVRLSDKGHEVYTHHGKIATGLDSVTWAREVERLGAGEILLNSIDRSGMGLGYDIALIKKVVNSTNIPIIACGGAGHYNDFKEVIQKTGVSAVAAGNIFHFKEICYRLAKNELKLSEINVR